MSFSLSCLQLRTTLESGNKMIICIGTLKAIASIKAILATKNLSTCKTVSLIAIALVSNPLLTCQLAVLLLFRPENFVWHIID